MKNGPEIAKSGCGAEEPAIQHTMETMVGYILQVGVVVSVALLVAGYAWRFLATGHLSFDYAIAGMNLYQFAMLEIRQVAAGGFRPRLLVSLGIVVLLLTPLVRVMASMVFFALVARNLKYALFTLFVLTVLAHSLLVR
jgi:uncharacterized membrane protein